MKISNSLAYLNKVGSLVRSEYNRIKRKLACIKVLLSNSKKAVYLGKNIMRLQTIFFHKECIKWKNR